MPIVEGGIHRTPQGGGALGQYVGAFKEGRLFVELPVNGLRPLRARTRTCGQEPIGAPELCYRPFAMASYTKPPESASR